MRWLWITGLCIAGLASHAGAQSFRMPADLNLSLERSPQVLVVVSLPTALSASVEGVADYTDGAAIRAYAERSAELFAAAKAKLQLDKQGMRVVRDYRYLPIVLVEVVSKGPAVFYLSNSTDIRSVTLNIPQAAFTGESLPLIGQPKARGYGATGKSVAVAVVDSGIDVKNAAFGCSAAGPGCTVVEARRMAPGASSPRHGTHIAAIVRATAPEADLIDLSVFRDNWVMPEDVIGAIDWVVANRTRHNIVAMNLSLGGGKNETLCSASAYAAAIEQAMRVGVLSVAAAGNDAWVDGIAEPACAPDAIAVGAVYDKDDATRKWRQCTDPKSRKGAVACFSNRAKILGILAPGADIDAGGMQLGGTSQAAPFVSGAVAALWSFFRHARPEQIREAILESGTKVHDPHSKLDFMRLDLERAFQRGKERKLPQ